MARLSARDRANLPDSAFAYVDSRGRRRLPIHDEPHVRNALARFDQVKFENEAARDRARQRLLNAAKRHGIVPVGFITGQLRTERRHAAAGRLVIELGRMGAAGELEEQLRSALGDPSLQVLHWSEAAGSYLDGTGRPIPLPSEDGGRAVTYLERQGRPMTALVHDPMVLDDPALSETVVAAVRFVIEKESLHGGVGAPPSDTDTLPTGFLTLLLTDIEGSTMLLRRLGDGYVEVLDGVRSLIRRAVHDAGGRVVEARADETFAVFERVDAGIHAAAGLQRGIGRRSWPQGLDVKVRAGLHSGPVTLTDTGYIGLAVHTAARVCAVAHGGQVVISGETKAAMGDAAPVGMRFRELGSFELAGMPRPEALYQVEADGLLHEFPPLRIGSR